MPITHPFVSEKSDSGNADLLQPSYWNAAHAMDAASPAGLAGATSAARFVGGTTTGAPVAGTFAVGDYVVAQDGKIHICTVAGSPGTWTAVSGGADLVQVASGAGSVRIPGLKGSADAVPASPSAYDEEFDGDLSAWTTLGSPATSNATDAKSHYHLAVPNGQWRVDGIYKACPSMPFTVTAKITDYLHSANYQQPAIMLGEASPGKLLLWGPLFHTAHAFWTTFVPLVWTNRTSRIGLPSGGSETDGPYRKPYIRLIVTSSTSIATQFSEDGLVWVTAHAAVNPGFTVGVVGLGASSNDTTAGHDSMFDWIRFT